MVIEHGAAVTLADAWTSLIADLEARKLSDQTIRKYKLLERQIKDYGEQCGLKMLAQFDLDVLINSGRRGKTDRGPLAKSWSGCAHSFGSRMIGSGLNRIRQRKSSCPKHPFVPRCR